MKAEEQLKKLDMVKQRIKSYPDFPKPGILFRLMFKVAAAAIILTRLTFLQHVLGWSNEEMTKRSSQFCIDNEYTIVMPAAHEFDHRDTKHNLNNFAKVLLSAVEKWSKQYSNLPDRYIKRAMEQVYFRNSIGPQYRAGVVVQRKRFRFTTNRPWSAEFKQQNAVGSHHKKVFTEPIKEWSFFRGDRVEVLVGNDKGKQGFIKMIIQERNWVIVEGLNCYMRRMAEDKKSQGFYILSELPLLVTTQVALVDPSDFKSTQIEWRFTEDGQKVRVSKRTGRIIPIPATVEETIDYKSKRTYKEQAKDTSASHVEQITFQPALKTFEMDIMDEMNIKEERQPLRTFWY